MTAGSNAPQPIRNLPGDVVEAANAFAAGVSLDRRFHGDIFIGGECYSTVTEAVRAAFMAGATQRSSFDIDRFQDINAARARRWHGGNLRQWSLLEWTGAMAGESGEACNVAKKLRRLELAIQHLQDGQRDEDTKALSDKLVREIADTVIYGLIVLSILGVPASTVIADVFDRKSVEYGFPERARGGVQASAGLVLPGCPQCGSGVFEGLERDVWACRRGGCGWRGPKP